MTELRHVDRGVTCDGTTHGTGRPLPCGATVWQSEVQDRLPSPSLPAFRKLLVKRGWALGVERSVSADPGPPQDFCPTHNPDKNLVAP